MVQKVNYVAWSGNVFAEVGVSKQTAGKQCPLCAVQNTCLGPSCLGLPGIKCFFALHVHVDANNNLFLEKLSPGNNDTRTSAPDSGVPGLNFVESLDKPNKWYV